MSPVSERAEALPSANADRPVGEPFLCVVRGNPAPEEIAALAAAFLAQDGDAAVCPASPARSAGQTRSAWGDPARLLRNHPGHRGPGGWRRLPHS
ncbi:MAG: acyl-CoA carboxylase subunit epsilon [Actinobacteria bacterium]|nr:acyl-CoA carboxylase subunit epsilon [Actinomycetota bacterium]